MDWDNEQVSLAKKEPRRGKRLTLAATVHCPSGPPLLVYSVHLEVSHSMLGKRCQKGSILNSCMGKTIACMAQSCAGWRKALPEEACQPIMHGHEVCEHMQVFCGMLARIAQFADIMLDAKQQIDKVMTQPLLDP